MPKIEISLVDIFKYVGDKERPLREGEALVKAGHIIFCGVDNEGKVKSLCLQTSALSQPPHEIEISFDGTPWTCHCSCKAGNSGFCKHVLGTLIYINRNEDLDELSCTDITQAWGKEKKAISEMYSQTEVSQFCHRCKKGFRVFHESEVTKEKNFHHLVNRLKTSALGKFIDRDASVAETSIRNSQDWPQLMEISEDIWQTLISNMNQSPILPVGHFDKVIETLRPCCQNIIQKLKCSNEVQNIIQGSEKWKKERQLRLTGSRCYSIFSFAKNEWESKALNYFWPKGFSNKFTQHGIKYEKEALQKYIEATQNEVRTPQFIVSRQFPWLGYSPDGVVFENGKPTILIEIKCPYTGSFHPAAELTTDCAFLDQVGNKVYLKRRHQYYGQVQMGMALLNLTVTHFIVYSSFSKSFVLVEVPLDAEFSKELLEHSSTKFLQHMLHYYCVNKNKMEL